VNSARSILAKAETLDLQPPPFREDDIVAYLLLILLGAVLVFAAYCVVMIWRSVRTHGAALKGSDPGQKRNFQLSIFHAPNRWLAIRSGFPDAVLAALGLHNPTPCSWEDGLAAAPEHKLFISPPVNGWVLVLGSELPDPADDVDECFRFITELSGKLGLVQFFSADRVINAHAWVAADQGTILRAYAWAGATLWHQGRMTPAECALGLKCCGYGELVERTDFSAPEPQRLNTEKVMHLAAQWSIDPSTIDPDTLSEALGIVGELSHTRLR
jgi:hypothetical protein